MEETLSEKIKRLRLKKGLTLEDIGKVAGVSKATVSRWESGIINNMGTDKVNAVAKVLGVTPEYLLGWDAEIQEAKDNEIKFALFGGESATDEELEEVRRFVEFIKAKREKEKRK